MEIMKSIRFTALGIWLTCSVCPGQVVSTNAPTANGFFLCRVTNGPAVLQAFRPNQPAFRTNAAGVVYRLPISKVLLAKTNFVFDHFLPESLNNLIWTNVIAHTNGRSVVVWSRREHPAGWPTIPPVVVWSTNSLIWGMKGLTALSPCWELEYGSGQVPITALTRRHGYTRGHDMGPAGFRTSYAGRKVWFVTPDNTLVEVRILREVIRTIASDKRDYTIVLFDRDLPDSIQPMRVISYPSLMAKYPEAHPWILFKTEQGGCVSAELEGFWLNTWKGGDSGSPDMLPLPGELIFKGGRSTGPPSEAMQRDMDALCRLAHLDPKRYQLQWLDVSAYPTYTVQTFY